MKHIPKKRGKKPRFSPLYTSNTRELAKRELLVQHGRDTDGAYRARNRQDKKDKCAS